MDENSTDWTLNARLGNPDFFLLAYLAVWGVGLAIEGYGGFGLGLSLGTVIAAIGGVVSFSRWRRLSSRQKVCLWLLLVLPVLAVGLFLPTL